MNNISIDISDKVETKKVLVLRSIKELAEELDIPFFIVGAFARDVVFEYIHKIPAPRITEDIDLGVNVANWEQFQQLKDTLIKREILTATNKPHRFVANTFNTIIDIVPYGGIAGETYQVSWPPSHDMIMSMLGFEEAYSSSVKVRLSTQPNLEILIPSIPALAFLKIISWDDAYPRRERDAQDLLFIMENYEATGIETMLYDTRSDLLTEEGYDPRLASVRLLGRDITKLCSSDTLNAVKIILLRETDENQGFRMLSHMVKGVSFQGTKFEKALQLLKKLLQGVQEDKVSK